MTNKQQVGTVTAPPEPTTFEFPSKREQDRKLEAALEAAATITPGTVVGVPDGYEARWLDPTMTADRIAEMAAIYASWGGVEMPRAEQISRGVYVQGCQAARIWIFCAGLSERLMVERRKRAAEATVQLHPQKRASLPVGGRSR